MKSKDEDELAAEAELQMLLDAYEPPNPKYYKAACRRLCQGEMQRFCQLMEVNNCN